MNTKKPERGTQGTWDEMVLMGMVLYNNVFYITLLCISIVKIYSSASSPGSWDVLCNVKCLNTCPLSGLKAKGFGEARFSLGSTGNLLIGSSLMTSTQASSFQANCKPQ